MYKELLGHTRQKNEKTMVPLHLVGAGHKYRITEGEFPNLGIRRLAYILKKDSA